MTTRPSLKRAPAYDIDAALKALAKADPKLAKVIARAGEFTMRLASAQSMFEALAESIVYQQLNGKAAATIHARLIEGFGGIHPTPELLLQAPDAQLRAAGLSGNKTRALRDLSAKVIDGTVPTLAKARRMGDEEIIERLTQVRGIGRWTVEMLLIFRLGRADVFPVNDYGVRKGFALTYLGLKPSDKVTPDLLPTPAQMHKRGEKWKPWRSIASWYMWRACDIASGKIPL
jgi:DNA-3-methyladenine glycosylase II